MLLIRIQRFILTLKWGQKWQGTYIYFKTILFTFMANYTVCFHYFLVKGVDWNGVRGLIEYFKTRSGSFIIKNNIHICIYILIDYDFVIVLIHMISIRLFFVSRLSQ